MKRWKRTLLSAMLCASMPAAVQAQDAAAANATAKSAAAQPDPNWERFVAALQPLGAQVRAKLPGKDPDGRLAAMLHQQLLGALSDGFHIWYTADPREPMLRRSFSTAINIAAPNADTAYHYALLDSDGTYRFSGIRGGSRIANVSLGSFWQAAGKLPTNRSNYSLDSLKLDTERRFSVIISKERPQGYDGDWWPLAPDAEAMGLREVFYEWGKELPTRVALERLDIASPVPSMKAEQREARMQRLIDIIKGEVYMWLDHVAQMDTVARPNQLHWQVYGNKAVGVSGQSYYEGAFKLADGEVLVLEATPPAQCRYWSVLLADRTFATIDWINHQSSLNGAQARLDADGKFRAVIAAHDPGVPNWLDPDGFRQGIVQGRWQDCEGAQVPTLTRVPIAKLRRYLPEDTPVVTPAQRDTQIRARRVGAQISGIR